jgi:hypothetical protein
VQDLAATAPQDARPLSSLPFGLNLRLGDRLQAMQKPAGAFGMGGGGEDCALVVLQYFEP